MNKYFSILCLAASIVLAACSTSNIEEPPSPEPPIDKPTDQEPAADLVVPPAGIEPTTYYFHAYSFMTSDNPRYEIRVVRQGEDIYFQGMFSLMPEAWVKGTIENNIVLIPSGQHLGTLPEGSTPYEIEDHEIYFSCSNDMRNKLPYFELEYDPLSDTFEGYYQYVLFTSGEDFDTIELLQNISFFSGRKESIVPPAGLTLSNYELQGIDGATGKTVKYYAHIGIDEDLVYVQGFSAAFPDVWTVGVLRPDGIISFRRNQYMGDTDVEVHGGEDGSQITVRNFDIWFTGIDYQNRVFSPALFTYDPATRNIRALESTWVVFNGDPASYHDLQTLREVTLTYKGEADDIENYQLVHAPKDLHTTTYSVLATNYTSSSKGRTEPTYSIAMGTASDGQVYIHGLSKDLPTAWLRGTMEGNDLILPTPQYLGMKGGTTDTWLVCTDADGNICPARFHRDASGAYTLHEGQRLYFTNTHTGTGTLPFRVLGNVVIQP